MSEKTSIHSVNLKQRIVTLNDLIIKGNTIEAMEIFYSNDVVMQENEEEPRRGKDLCISYEKKMLKGTQSNASRLLHQAIDFENNVVFGEWEHSFMTHDKKTFRLTEVSIQHWSDGLIMAEKFYYKEIKTV